MKRSASRSLFLALLGPLIILVGLVVNTGTASAAYNPNYLISDKLFTDYASMTSAEIQNFLVGKNSGLKTLTDIEDCGDPGGAHYSYYDTYYDCGATVSAAEIIYDVAQAYSISPKAILATMQKEQSLVTTPNPTASQINCAMGYNSCNGYVGFFTQVENGSWQFQLYLKRIAGDNSWWNPAINYPCSNASSLYSAGLYPSNTVTFYNPGGSARTVTIANAATAGLYCYTPHVGPYNETGYSGSYNFVTSFELWFGSVSSPCYNDYDAAGGFGPRIITYKYAGVDRLAYTQLNKTVSQCMEVHVWNSTFSGWITNIATGMRATNPSEGVIVPSRSRVDNQSSINFVTVGNVEVHRLSPNLQKFPGYYDSPTNLNGNTILGTFVAGDFFGNGTDYLAYILYAGTNGGMEVHMFNPTFNPTMTQAVGFYDLPSDIGAVNNGVFVAGDFLGRGYAQLAYVSYGNTEVHLLDIRGGKATRIYEVPTNLTGTSSTTGTFVAGDFLGRGYAQLAYVIYNNGSRVETHMFDRSLTKINGTQDIITNKEGFSL